MIDHSTTWQPTTSADPLAGLRASIGQARRSRIFDAIRLRDGYGRGDVVPMGILLKEGET